MTTAEATFIRHQNLKKAFIAAVDHLNAGEYEECKSILENALKPVQDLPPLRTAK